jgi:hypothetical protein
MLDDVRVCISNTRTRSAGLRNLRRQESAHIHWYQATLKIRVLLISALPLLPWSARAQSLTPGQPIAPSVESTAELVGVLSELTELRTLSAGTALADRWRVLWLHQYISERIMATSLQVDATIAQIDNEISRANEVHSYLADRRDRTVNRLNLLSVIVGGGLGATSSGLQLSSTLSKPAAGVGIGAGALSASLAVVGIHAQKGGNSRFDFQSNMLAEFFDRPALPDSHYPAMIWTFLNEPAPNGPNGLTRKQQLIQTWVEVKRIDSLASVDKIDRLTSQPSERVDLSIDDFEDRAAMLQDIRARVSFLKRDLGALIAALPPVGELSHQVQQGPCATWDDEGRIRPCHTGEPASRN